MRKPEFAERFGTARLDPPPLTCGRIQFIEGHNPAGPAFRSPFQIAPLALPKGIDACGRFVREAVASMPAKHLLIYVHGYRNSLDSAIRTAVAWANGLKFNGTILVWGWPSEDAVNRYARDEDGVRWSAPNLAEFLSRILSENESLRVSLVSHSMGSRIALAVLETIFKERSGQRVDTVIFAAADEDQAVFISSWRRALQALANQMSRHLSTLYASSNDWALEFSEKRHEGPRAGSGGVSRILTLNQMESIDASALTADILGHSYFFEHSKAVEDAAKILTDRTNADGRGLERQMLGERQFWILKE